MEFIEIPVRLTDELLVSNERSLNFIRTILKQIKMSDEWHRKKNLNKAIAKLMKQADWDTNFELCKSPKLLPDFYKDEVMVEVQFELKFGLYGDIYKFQYADVKKKSNLNVLIILEESSKASDGKGNPNAIYHERVLDLLSMDYFNFPVLLFVITG